MTHWNYLQFQYYSSGNTFNVQTRTIKFDFNNDPPAYESIEQQLCGLEIGILGEFVLGGDSVTSH